MKQKSSERVLIESLKHEQKWHTARAGVDSFSYLSRCVCLISRHVFVSAPLFFLHASPSVCLRLSACERRSYHTLSCDIAIFLWTVIGKKKNNIQVVERRCTTVTLSQWHGLKGKEEGKKEEKDDMQNDTALTSHQFFLLSFWYSSLVFSSCLVRSLSSSLSWVQILFTIHVSLYLLVLHFVALWLHDDACYKIL